MRTYCVQNVSCYRQNVVHLSWRENSAFTRSCAACFPDPQWVSRLAKHESLWIRYYRRSSQSVWIQSLHIVQHQWVFVQTVCINMATHMFRWSSLSDYSIYTCKTAAMLPLQEEPSFLERMTPESSPFLRCLNKIPTVNLIVKYASWPMSSPVELYVRPCCLLTSLNCRTRNAERRR